MSKKCMVSFVLLLAMFSANAQFRKIPAEVTDSFKIRYENASGVSWKDKLISFEADFKQGDKEMQAFFSSKGEWIKTETRCTFETLPDEVKNGFEKSKYADLTPFVVMQVDEKDNKIQYRLVVKKNDISKRSLLFSKDGQLISDNISF